MQSRINFHDVPTRFFEQSIKALLSLLLLALLLGIGAGIARIGLETVRSLPHLFGEEGLHHSFRWLLVDALTVLAVVEVYRTAMTYFIEGRVKVTYIIDTVLVAVLTEVLAFWYRDIEPIRLTMVLALVATLMLVRIFAIRFSPRRLKHDEGL